MTTAHTAAASIRDALAASANLDALDLARAALESTPHDVELNYLAALCSARLGTSAYARSYLARITAVDSLDLGLKADIASLEGRLAKDDFARTGSQHARQPALDRAIDAYLAAFAHSGRSYPAINAASLLFLAGRLDESRRLARQVLALCDGDAQPDSYWQLVTRAEACLLLDLEGQAARLYENAAHEAGGRHGDVASTRAQLRLLAPILPAAARMLDILVGPTIIAFSGHMIDAPGSIPERFPDGLQNAVRAAIAAQIAARLPAIGYAQAACGADTVFLEAMQDAGAETHVVLPFHRDDFVGVSVAFAGAGWVERFDRAMQRARSVTYATKEPYLDDDVLFEHASTLIQGMAFLRSRDFGTRPVMLNVLDPQAEASPGGAVATTTQWARRGGDVFSIDLAALRSKMQSSALPHGWLPATVQPSVRSHPPIRRKISSILFADVRGFARVPEQHSPAFAIQFLGAARAALELCPKGSFDASTRGDGLFVVFDTPDNAAQFALNLRDAVNKIRWPEMGMPDDTSVRIGLHTGPVYETDDPVMGRRGYYGTHVNLTARLEPVVVPGSIFVTEAFAASLAATNQKQFSCDYIGRMPLAKAFGEERLYDLR
jgi:class 3 adenylate cyclase